jgi:hypothetical protein
MQTFLVSYDLAKPTRNKHALATAIMGLGSSWARPLECTWYVRADVSEGQVAARLSSLLDVDDGLIVQAVEEEATLANTSLRWFRQRRPGFDLEAGSNILAFPTVTPPPAPAQQELPLAEAS